MRTPTIAAAALALALAAGCKDKREPARQEAPGSRAPSAGAQGSAQDAAVPPPAAPQAGGALAQAYVACAALIGAARWDDYERRCLSPSFAAHTVDAEDVRREQVLPKLRDEKVAFPDLALAPQVVLVSGRTVLAVSLMTGTNTGPLQGERGTLPATKQQVGLLLFDRVAMDEESRPAELWTYLEPGTLLGQLGYRPKELPPVRPALAQGLAGAPIIAVAAGDERERANAALVRRHNEVLNAKQAADVLALWADDALEADQALAADARGKPQIEAAFRALWRAFPDGKSELAEVWAAGDYVAAVARFTGTHDGPLGALPKTGRPVVFQYAELYKLADGKIAALWRFRNDAAIARQLGLGVAAAPPAAGKGSAGGAGSAAGAPTSPSSPGQTVAPPTPLPKRAPEPPPRTPVRAPDPPAPIM